ncbi:hypothetical protein GQ43DRAFT_444175 [Delitschia confertaspora ATCC 74209]|uniref:Uncharacterized protein n=1 Tax=Delitschia confertaspora ATCC 74209 TaxID=1513339 RepID=A0A9P4JIX5_9PLEO|nr:hypothetical protein GQ43DRAFT_444175 [Delitschia confertaspora ATCC 74209]
MMHLPTTLFAALSLVTTFVNADVEFISPKAGSTLNGGGAIEIEWKDSGEAPSIADLTTYQLFLCAGGNDEATMIPCPALTPTPGQFSVTGNKATGTVGIGIGADTKNAYFLKIISTAKTGGTVTNYSPRFTLKGMMGTFPANVVTALEGITDTKGPPTVNNVGDANNPAALPDASLFMQPYTMQTGITRYAPMQPIPPTKITKREQKPLYPTSAVTIAKTILPLPKPQTTITQSQTFSISSRENPATPAPHPKDDMAKFLARWKD